MPTKFPATSLLSQAKSAASEAAVRAGVNVIDAHGMDQLLEIEAMLISVWGTTHHGAPIPVDLLRSIGHAGCNITAAYDRAGNLCGAAVAIISPAASAYSLIAGVLPTAADAGVGFALKQHQRAWALARGLENMSWTFDPLVSRNARFNLTKLGASSSEYLPNFYGSMNDGINANDESDRLVAMWPLASSSTVACSFGNTEPVELPAYTRDDISALGPDGEPSLVNVLGTLWCRVPKDIVALRGQAPEEAAAWRVAVRHAFTTAFASGYTATGVTRTGWYRLATGGPR